MNSSEHAEVVGGALKIGRGLVNMVRVVFSPLLILARWHRRLKPKQAAGLIMIVLLLMPPVSVKALDAAPIAPTSSGGQVPTAANASVAGNTGTYTTGMEIDLPPGRTGMVPKLELSYASGSGNGYLGVGWNLPMTSISRVGARKGVAALLVDFASDEFYLSLSGSGARLLPVEMPGSTDINTIIEDCNAVSNLYSYQTPQGSGNNNANGNGNENVNNLTTSNQYCVRRYHTEIESWLKAEAYFARKLKAIGSSEYTADPAGLMFWVITTKTGMQMSLGTVDSAKIPNFAWQLVRSLDTHGNTIDYQYTPGQQSAGYLYYQRIAYTGYVGGGSLVAASPTYNYYVHFTLESRRDFNVSYRAGYKQILGERYKGIFVSTQPTFSPGFTSSITNYNLRYRQSFKTGRSLLEEIEHFGSFTGGESPSPLKYPGSVYTYRDSEDLPRGWSEDPDLASGYGRGNWFGNCDTFGCHDWGGRMADVDGDGLPDKVDHLNNVGITQPGNGDDEILINNDHAFDTTYLDRVPGTAFATHENNTGRVFDYGARIFDINNDGRPDKIDYGNLTPTNRAFLGTGTGFSSQYNYFLRALSSYPSDIVFLPLPTLSIVQAPPESNTSSGELIPIAGSGGASQNAGGGGNAPNACDDPPCGGGGGGGGEPLSPVLSLISGPGISSPSQSPIGVVEFQWKPYRPQFGFIYRYTLTGPNGYSKTERDLTFPLLQTENLVNGTYTLSLTVYGSPASSWEVIPNTLTHNFSVSKQTTLQPVAKFTGLPREGLVLNVPFTWGCRTNCGAAPEFSYSVHSEDYSAYSSSLTGVTLALATTNSPLFLKVRVNGIESRIIYWSFSLGGNVIPSGISPFSEVQLPSNIELDRGTRIADLNGDGLPDLLTLQDGSLYKFAVYLQTPHGFEAAPQWIPPNVAFSTLRPQSTPTGAVHYLSEMTGWELQDVNGDGLADLTLSYRRSATDQFNQVILNNGHGFNSFFGERLTRTTTADPWSGTVVGCDFCQGGGFGADGAASMSFYTSQAKTNFFPGGSRQTLQPRGNRYMDVNGDGLPDLVLNFSTQSGQAFGEVYINTGAGWRFTGSISLGNQNMPSAFMHINNDGSVNDNSIQCDNFRGTGMLDCFDYHQIYINNRQQESKKFHAMQDKIPDLMVRVDNSFGGFNTISYLSSTDFLETFHPITPALQSGEVTKSLMPITLQVVDTLTSCDGRGQCYITRYQYAGAKFDRFRHEFRGYRVVRAWEAHSDPGLSEAYSDTYYRQDFPFAGMVDKTEAYTRAGQALGRSYLQYEKIELPSLQPGFPRLMVQKIRDRMDTYDQEFPTTQGETPLLSDPYNYKTSVASEYRYDDIGNPVMMHGFGLVTPPSGTCPADPTDPLYATCPFTFTDQTPTDDVGSVTQFYIQGDERIPDGSGGLTLMASGAWRVGIVKSSQSYQVPPASGYQVEPTPSPGGPVLTATRFCYDGMASGCNAAGPITFGDITHSSVWLDKDDVYPNGTTRPGNRFITSLTQFNAFGQVSAITDHAGNTTTYSYNDNLGNNSLLSRITDAIGNESRYIYNEAGLLIQSFDINDVETVYFYDRLWRPLKVFKPAMDPVNPAIRYEYHFAPNFSTDVNSQYVATFKLLDWNQSTEIESRSYFDGMMRSYANVSPHPDPALFNNGSGSGVWSMTVWNDQGLQLDSYRPLAASFTGAPPPFSAFSNQPKTHVTYDLKKRPIRTDYPDGTRSVTLQSGLEAMAVDGKNHWVVHIKDGAGRLVTMRENTTSGDPYNAAVPATYYQTRYFFDTLGRLTGVRDPLGNDLISNLTYDSLGRKLRIDDKDTGTTRSYFDDQGRLVKEQDARGVVTMLLYDSLNRVTDKSYDVTGATNVPTLTAAHYEYGTQADKPFFGNGRIKTRSDAGGSETFKYDALGAPLMATRRVTGYSFDFPLIRTYNALGQVKTLKYPDGYVVTNTIADNGVLTAVSGQATGGPVTQFATFDLINEVGQMTQGTVVDGKIRRQFSYDFATGRPKQQRESRVSDTGQLQDLAYFALALCVPECQPDTMAYDEVGNITFILGSINKPGGAYQNVDQQFTYDALNRLSQANSTLGYGTVDYSYDEIGNLTMKDGKSYSYPPINAALPHAVQSIGGTEFFTYDLAGNMKTYTAPGAATAITWDAEGRPDSIIHTKDAITRNYAYTYDDGGGRVKKQLADPVASKSYARLYFGNLYEVQIENGGSYITHTKHIFAGASRISTITETSGVIQFASMLEHQNHEQSAAVYAAIAAQQGGSFWSGANFARLYHQAAIQYEMHAAGINTAALLALSLFLLAGLVISLRRSVREITGAVAYRRLWTIKWMPKWVYVPISYATLVTFILQIILSTGVSIPSYAQVAALNATPAGLPIGTYFYLVNHLGSTTVILDDQAEVVDMTVYKPFGELWNPANETKSFRFYFTGKEKEEFDLYQFGVRWYSPEIGRFISADSMIPKPADSQQFNRYTYANNNPINMVDPTGHFAWVAVIIGAVMGAVSAAAQGASGSGILIGAVIGAVGGAIGGWAFSAAYSGAIAAGASVASAQLSGALLSAYASAWLSATIAAVSGQDAGQAALLAFAAGAAGAGLGYAGQGWGAATQRTVAILGGMAISGASAAITGGNVAVAIGVAFAASVSNFTADAIQGAYAKHKITSSLRKQGINLPKNPFVLDKEQTPIGGPKIYKLSEQAKKVLGVFFNHNVQTNDALDLSKIRSGFGLVIGGTAYTINDFITIKESSWNKLSPLQRFGLLVHEITHTAQQSLAGGFFKFMNRYRSEHARSDNYDIPDSLHQSAMYDIDITSKDYTYDQIADRMEEIFMSSTAKYGGNSWQSF